MQILKLKNTMSEMKILLDGLNNRKEVTEGRVSKFEDRSKEIIQPNEKKKKTETK